MKHVEMRWTSQKVEEAYADPSLTMVAWPVATFTEETLHGLEEQAEAAMNLTCTEVQAGGTIVPAANACFKLVFRQILVQTVVFACGGGWTFRKDRLCHQSSLLGLPGNPSTTSTPALQQALPSSPTMCPLSLKPQLTTSRMITAMTLSPLLSFQRRLRPLKRLIGVLQCWAQWSWTWQLSSVSSCCSLRWRNYPRSHSSAPCSLPLLPGLCWPVLSSCSSLKPLTWWQWDGVQRWMWFGDGVLWSWLAWCCLL